MTRCSFREWIPILPWPVWPLAGQFLLGQNVVVGSMMVLLALCGSMPRGVYLGPHFRYKCAAPRLSAELPIRVSELANLTVADVDFTKPAITVRGKGNTEREIALEKRGVQALKNYLAVRPENLSDVLFLNYKGEPISERGIRKLVVKYRKNAGITNQASCHTLRHTFATYKAERGVSPFQLQQWLGHANLNTTQIYVHLGKQNAKKIMEQTSLP